MVLRMASPVKRKGSDNWWYRRSIPADVKRILAELPRERRPRNWYSTHIYISLRTADRQRAKAKYAEVADQVERQMTALREGPNPLTPKQIAALSGEVYRAFAEGLEDNPVLSPEQWRDIAEGAREARNGSPLLIADDPAERRAFTMERRFGRMADAILAKRVVVTDEASRWKLIERLSIDMPEAAEKLARNADADFSPDKYVERFPSWDSNKPNNVPGRSLRALADAWHAAALARKVSERDADRFRSVVVRFAKWLGHDDAARVSRADVARWADARSAAGIATSTINKVDTAALRAVFGWCVERGMIAANPLAHNVRIKSRGKAKVREPFFSDNEASAILRAALSVQPTKREDPKTTAAKRWVPWLCAYSGARVVEMIQLRKQDVRREGASWVARLTPEAGGIKTNQFRDVPLHEHLIALGFGVFVEAAPSGPLFFNGSKQGDNTGPVDGVYARLRKFVRAVVDDRNVQPNHAWRYTFKTRGLEADIEPLVLDAIRGHAPGTKGADYTKVTLKKRFAAMKKLPRYTSATTDETRAAR